MLSQTEFSASNGTNCYFVELTSKVAVATSGNHGVKFHEI